MRNIINISVVIMLFGITACNEQKKESPSNTQADAQVNSAEQKNLETAKQVWKVWNGGDTNTLKAIAIPALTRHANGVLASSDLQGYTATWAAFRTAIPDMNFTFDLVAKGNKVYSKWIAKGTNTGMFGTFSPSGKPIVTNGFTEYTYNAEGKLIQEDAYYDPYSYEEAIGFKLVPPSAKK